MLELIVIVAFLLFCAAAVCVAKAEARERSWTDAFQHELLKADQRITDDYRQARRAMNDAAGQSWRNLAG